MTLRKLGPKHTEQLTEILRSSIINRRFLPGAQLPSFTKMEDMFDASRGALQIALEPLKQQGFVLSRPRKGLFVNPHPPHLRRYGLLLPHSPSEAHWSRLDDALFKIAHHIKVEDSDGRTFIPFTGLVEPATAKSALENLSEQVRTHQLAGLILTPATFRLGTIPPFNHPAIPKVYIFGDISKGQAPYVVAEGMEIILRGLKALQAKRRSRIAILHLAGTFSEIKEDLVAHKQTLSNPRWIQSVSRSHPETVQNLIPLLFDYPPDERPDGLIIADDNLVEHSIRTLVEMGLQPGKDLDLIAHCNWPWPVPSVVPMQRIGFHAADFLANSVSIIDRVRAGEEHPESLQVTALFEEEVRGAEAARPPPTILNRSDDFIAMQGA